MYLKVVYGGQDRAAVVARQSGETEVRQRRRRPLSSAGLVFGRVREKMAGENFGVAADERAHVARQLRCRGEYHLRHSRRKVLLQLQTKLAVMTSTLFAGRKKLSVGFATLGGEAHNAP